MISGSSLKIMQVTTLSPTRTGLPSGINLYVSTHFYDLSGSLMSQSYRDQAEGISLETHEHRYRRRRSPLPLRGYRRRRLPASDTLRYRNLAQGGEDCYVACPGISPAAVAAGSAFTAGATSAGSRLPSSQPGPCLYDFFNTHLHVYHSLSDAKRIAHDTSSCLCKALCRGKTLSGTAADGEGWDILLRRSPVPHRKVRSLRKWRCQWLFQIWSDC